MCKYIYLILSDSSKYHICGVEQLYFLDVQALRSARRLSRAQGRTQLSMACLRRDVRTVLLPLRPFTRSIYVSLSLSHPQMCRNNARRDDMRLTLHGVKVTPPIIRSP